MVVRDPQVGRGPRDDFETKLLSQIGSERYKKIVKSGVAPMGESRCNADRHCSLFFRAEQLNVRDSPLEASCMLGIRNEIAMGGIGKCSVCAHEVFNTAVAPAVRLVAR